jgi:perosamine synthetase
MSGSTEAKSDNECFENSKSRVQKKERHPYKALKNDQNSTCVSIPFSKPAMTKEMTDAALESLLNDRLVNGLSVKEFEDSFARYIGTKYAVAVNSGTAALLLSLKSIGVGKDDIVITQSASFIATANAIVHAGATPLLLDIDSKTLELRKDQLQEAIKIYGNKIKAIIPVHLYGRMQTIEKISEVKGAESIPVIEDACQAHGAELNGKKAGSNGTSGAFSFYSSKNMTVAGDGGMITTDDPEIRDKALSMRNQGAYNGDRYRNDIIGYNFRLNSVNAAIGKIQLKYLDQWNRNRAKIAELYADRLSDCPGIKIPDRDSSFSRSSWHIYSIRTDRREELAENLKQNGIETGVHYPIPIHLQNAYRNGLALVPFAMENTEKWANENLSLPIFGTMRIDSAEEVVNKINTYFGRMLK